MEEKKHFADDLDKGGNDPEKEEGHGMNQYVSLHDKWNDIQEAYIQEYPDLETADLYFESGGFEGLLERISELRGKTVEEVRTEIENW